MESLLDLGFSLERVEIDFQQNSAFGCLFFGPLLLYT
jgi:hypothetical protein